MSTSTSPTRAPKSPVTETTPAAATARAASPAPASKSPVKDTASASASDQQHQEGGEAATTANGNGNGERRNNRRGPRAPRERDPAEEARKVFVGNLAYSATEDDIRAHFQAAGEIESIRIAFAYNKPKGFGFVTFKDESAVAKAVADYHKSELNDRTINVEAAATREPRERKPRQPRERKPRAEGEEGEHVEGQQEAGERRRERRPRKPRNKSAGGAGAGAEGAAAADGEQHAQDQAAGENGEAANNSKRAPRRRNDRRARRSSQDAGAEGERERAPREPRKPLSETGTPLPTTIYVRNLAQGTTEDEIAEWVKANGFTVVKASLFHKSGSSRLHRPPRDFAFVELESTEAQTKAVEELNGKELKERALVVQVAYEKVERKRRERKPVEGGDKEAKAPEAAVEETEAQAVVAAKEQEE
ncbi:hypothetical protein BCR44DRAFT_1465278 [Catenaria anguillulae PL171]|uniref:RRM domain-containing protein n=1 Tax=Catenaria anguillulae PL171 TaxID=765915 RepID=A0A1Y2H672_9FUNG|nr:hypothetical protein BCR44DRAFT_1465278 [Catenaria anguillulae PL171]